MADVYGYNTYERAITCRSVLTDTENTKIFKENHEQNPLYRQVESNCIYNPLDFNSPVDTLQRSFFHACANEWIIVQGVFPESWWVNVCCIHLFGV